MEDQIKIVRVKDLIGEIQFYLGKLEHQLLNSDNKDTVHKSQEKINYLYHQLSNIAR